MCTSLYLYIVSYTNITVQQQQQQSFTAGVDYDVRTLINWIVTRLYKDVCIRNNQLNHKHMVNDYLISHIYSIDKALDHVGHRYSIDKTPDHAMYKCNWRIFKYVST